LRRQWPNRIGSASSGPAEAFTLIELLVVVAIIGLLVSILVPCLGAARQQTRSALCLANLRVLGQGLSIYVGENRDVLPPSRLPKLSSKCDPYAVIYGRRKYRPTFVASMSRSVGVPPFDDPQACKDGRDIYGEAGDRQNYSCRSYVCPTVAEWTDERNGSYGYNYQFLGNSRLRDDADPGSYKNWPVQITWIRRPGQTVAMGDGMGTAASWGPADRLPYANNGKEPRAYGNEGFNLDPPWVDPVEGEMAGFDDSPQTRSAVDPRHSGRGNVLWLDGHAVACTLEQLGYRLAEDGSIALEGENQLWSGNGADVPWTPTFKP